MVITEKVKGKMYRAWLQKKSLAYVCKEVGCSFPTAKKVMLAERWDQREVREVAVREQENIVQIEQEVQTEQQLLRAIVLKISKSILLDPDKRYSLNELKTAIEIYYLVNGIDLNKISDPNNRGPSVNVNIQNNVKDVDNTEKKEIFPNTSLTSEERTLIYKTLNKAKEREMPNKPSKEEVIDSDN